MSSDSDRSAGHSDHYNKGRKCVQCNGDISDYSEEYDRCVWCEYEVVGT